MASVFWITGNPDASYQLQRASYWKVVTDAAKKLMADKIARQKERGIKIETLWP